MQGKLETKTRHYLINCESNFYGAIFVDLWHYVIWIRTYSVRIDTEMLFFLPNLVLHLAFLFTHWCRISRFASRMLATNLIEIWIALQKSVGVGLLCVYTNMRCYEFKMKLCFWTILDSTNKYIVPLPCRENFKLNMDNGGWRSAYTTALLSWRKRAITIQITL